MKNSLLTLCAIVGLGFEVMAQGPGPGSAYWTPQATGFATPSRGIRDISTPSATVAWAVTYDGSGANAPTTDFTRTTNGGIVWTPGNLGAVGNGYSFSNISAIDANTAWVAMFKSGSSTGGGGRILKTTDGGATWNRQTTASFIGSDAFPNLVHMFDANNGFVLGDPNGGFYEIYTTTNGGTNWTRTPSANIPAPLTDEAGTVDVYTTVGNNIIYFGTNKGRVFKSTDGGLNWTVGGPTGLSSIHDVVFSSATYGLVREGTDMVKTTDGGVTWSVIPYSGTMYTSDIAYVPGTANSFVSTGADSIASGSSYSADGGLTWIDYDNGFQRTAVSFYSPTVGYAGGFNLDASTYGIFKFTGAVIGGINNKEFSKNVTVYPNPSAGILNIQLEKGIGNKIAISVADLTGRTVFNKTDLINGGSYNNQIDLSNLSKGVYMLQVQNGENISLRKIVIE